jgi:hypothetical protein
MTIESAGAANFIQVFASGNLNINQSGWAETIVIESAGTATVYGNGVAKSIKINNGRKTNCTTKWIYRNY